MSKNRNDMDNFQKITKRNINNFDEQVEEGKIAFNDIDIEELGKAQEMGPELKSIEEEEESNLDFEGSLNFLNGIKSDPSWLGLEEIEGSLLNSIASDQQGLSQKESNLDEIRNDQDVFYDDDDDFGNAFDDEQGTTNRQSVLSQKESNLDKIRNDQDVFYDDDDDDFGNAFDDEQGTTNRQSVLSQKESNLDKIRNDQDVFYDDDDDLSNAFRSIVSNKQEAQNDDDDLSNDFESESSNEQVTNNRLYDDDFESDSGIALEQESINLGRSEVKFAGKDNLLRLATELNQEIKKLKEEMLNNSLEIVEYKEKLISLDNKVLEMNALMKNIEKDIVRKENYPEVYEAIKNYEDLINKININKKETDFGKSKKLTNVSQPATALSEEESKPGSEMQNNELEDSFFDIRSEDFREPENSYEGGYDEPIKTELSPKKDDTFGITRQKSELSKPRNTKAQDEREKRSKEKIEKYKQMHKEEEEYYLNESSRSSKSRSSNISSKLARKDSEEEAIKEFLLLERLCKTEDEKQVAKKRANEHSSLSEGSTPRSGIRGSMLGLERDSINRASSGISSSMLNPEKYYNSDGSRKSLIKRQIETLKPISEENTIKKQEEAEARKSLRKLRQRKYKEIEDERKLNSSKDKNSFNSYSSRNSGQNKDANEHSALSEGSTPRSGIRGSMLGLERDSINRASLGISRYIVRSQKKGGNSPDIKNPRTTRTIAQKARNIKINEEFSSRGSKGSSRRSESRISNISSDNNGENSFQKGKNKILSFQEWEDRILSDKSKENMLRKQREAEDKKRTDENKMKERLERLERQKKFLEEHTKELERKSREIADKKSNTKGKELSSARGKKKNYGLGI